MRNVKTKKRWAASLNTPATCGRSSGYVSSRTFVRSRPASPTRINVVDCGQIKWFSPQKRYGFIECKSLHRDIFFHVSSLPRDLSVMPEKLQCGQQVSFNLARDRKGRAQATNVMFKRVSIDGLITAEAVNDLGSFTTSENNSQSPARKRAGVSCEQQVLAAEAVNDQEINTNILKESEISENNVKLSSADDTNNTDFSLELCRLGKTDIVEKPTGAYFLFEETLKFYLLVDTGATKSLLPRKMFSPSKKNSETIRGVTGSTMASHGTLKLMLDFQLATSFQHEFLVVDLRFSYGILGNDFLAAHPFQLCFSTSTLTHIPTKSFVELTKPECYSLVKKGPHNPNPHTDHHVLQCIRENIKELSSRLHLNTAEEKILRKIMSSFPNIFKEPAYHEPPKHNFFLDIEFFEEILSLYQRPRKVTAAEFHVINENYESQEKSGAVIRRSSNFASPVTVVKKKNGDNRVCVDYRRLNALTVDINFPIPLISNLQFLLSSEHQWYSVLDLRSAYHSLPLTKRAAERAAIITQRGTYQPLRSPFGLKNSPAKFCELIASVIEGLESFVFAYLDDFLVFSRTFSDHQSHLRILLTRLDSYGLFVNAEKCKLARNEVVFLGHSVSQHGMRPLTEKVDFIASIKTPKTLRELRSFLGIVNYYKDHCKGLSQITAPLSKLLCGPKRRKRAPIPWENEHEKSFSAAIRALKEAETLSHDDITRPLVLSTDASETHAGGVLEQFISAKHDDFVVRKKHTPEKNQAQVITTEKEHGTRPLSYFSQAFESSTKVRSTFNRELSALYMAIRHFRFKLRGRKLIIRTDHRSLVRAVENPEGLHSPLERRMIYQIKEYMPVLLFLSGSANNVADHLSRPTLDVDTSTSTLSGSHNATESENHPSRTHTHIQSPSLNYFPSIKNHFPLSHSIAAADTGTAETQVLTKPALDTPTSTTTLSDDHNATKSENHPSRTHTPIQSPSFGCAPSIKNHFSLPHSIAAVDTATPVTEDPTEEINVVTTSTTPPTLSLSMIADAQSRCPLAQDATSLQEQLPAEDRVLEKHVSQDNNTFSIVGVQDVEHEYFRPYLPQDLRIIAYNQLHGVIHQGKKKSCEVLQARYFWPGMKTDIEKWTKTCPECQQCKVSRHTRQRLQCYPPNPRRLSTIHIDLMASLPVSTNYAKYILTMRDRGTGFLVSAPISDKMSCSVLTALRSSFISCFGVPTTIISDNGREFTSGEFQTFCSELAITHKFVNTYHPQANGLVERIHRTIRVALSALEDPSSWAEALPLITLAINNQISDNNSFTPYQMVFGQAARLPGTFFFTENDEVSTTLQPIEKLQVFQENMRFFSRTSRQQEISNPYVSCDLFTVPEVLLRDDGNHTPLSKVYSGPFGVVARKDKYFTLLTDRGPQNVSIDRLKPYYRLCDGE